MKIENISDFIYDNFGEKFNLSKSFIKFWIISNIPKVNKLLQNNFKDEFPRDILFIFEKLFLIYYYDYKEKTDCNIIIDLKNKESLKKINRNSISKTYKLAKKEIEKELKILINNYRLKV